VPRGLRTVLISGATGFVARGLVERLAKRFRVIGLARRRERAFLLENVEWVVADLRGSFRGRGLPERLDHIIHVATIPPSWPKQNPRDIFCVNTLSTLDLLEAGKARHLRSFILISTGAVYGFGNRPHRETSPINPNSFYALTKRQAEELAQAYGGVFPVIILRLFFPYGPGQVRNLIPSLIGKIARDEPLFRNQGGGPMINPIYISDFQRAMERCLRLKESAVINLAGNEKVKVEALATRIGRLLGKKPRFEESGERPGDLLGDNSRMKRVLGVTPGISLREGLRRTVVAG
jgi:nucleoside-diphosphate-sugar epimerase